MTSGIEYAIETDGLTRRFGDFVAVDGVSLRIPKGHLYGFLGLNGAGKTTTIRMLTTLLPPSGGSARLWGHDVVKEPLAVRALIGHPKVLFLDEPTRGLDLPAKRDMWNLLRRLAANENVTMFLSSHDAQEIRSLCSEISVIANGRVIYTGLTGELGPDLDTFEERLIELLTQQGRAA